MFPNVPRAISAGELEMYPYIGKVYTRQQHVKAAPELTLVQKVDQLLTRVSFLETELGIRLR
jgi:hypothetical protein